MSASVDTMTGATLAAGTSSWSAELTSLSFSGVTRAAIDTSHLGTTAASSNEMGGKTYIPAGLSDGGTLEIEGHFNPDTLPPIDAVAETWTLTFPASGGDGTGANYAFSGFMTSFAPGNVVNDDKATFSATVQVSGVITRTAGSV